MSSGPIVLIRLGEPVLPSRTRLGPYEMWFQRAVEEPLGVVDLRDPEQSVPEDAAATIIMGSPVSVYDDHPWMPRALDEARKLLAGPKPTLGVCFGHQLFCMARGGEVKRNTQVEVGTIDVFLNHNAQGDPLFGGFSGRLRVNASHDDAIRRLPTEAPPAVLGGSDLDGNQVLRWGPRAWSVQFHPEMRQAETRLAVQWRAPRITEEGGDPAAVSEAVDDAPDGLTLLRRFVELVRRA